MYGGWNTNVYSNEWRSTSSTNGQVVGALFRIFNTLGSQVSWTAYWYYTSYGGWAEYASVAHNGGDYWTTSASCGVCTVGVTLPFPANRVSTAIFISTSSQASTTRSTSIIFYSNCLNLPSGLEFRDDLSTAIGGWEQ